MLGFISDYWDLKVSETSYVMVGLYCYFYCMLMNSQVTSTEIEINCFLSRINRYGSLFLNDSA